MIAGDMKNRDLHSGMAEHDKILLIIFAAVCIKIISDISIDNDGINLGGIDD
jgi:hypothetical protein